MDNEHHKTEEDANDANDALSCSMYIDEKKSYSTGSIPIEIKSIHQRKTYAWVQDNNVISCYKCDAQFGYIKRSHHCRCCGRIFCYYCCNQWIDIKQTELIELPVEPVKGKLASLTDSINWSSGIRVCENCCKYIKTINSVADLFTVYKETMTIKQVYELTQSKNEKKKETANFYLSKFREIQYKLPFKKFSNIELELLNKNKNFFAQHSKWIYQLIMGLDVKNKDEIQIVIELLEATKKTIKCRNLLCSSECSIKLNAYQTCNILTYKQNLPDKIVLLILPALDDITNDMLDCYFMMFTNRLIDEDIIGGKKPLTSYVFNRIKNSLKLIYALIVNLNAMKLSDEEQRGIVLRRINLKLIEYLMNNNKELYVKINKITTFVNMFEKKVTNEYIATDIKRYVQASTPLHLPFKMEYTYEDIDQDSIEKKISYYSPIVIPFVRTKKPIKNINITDSVSVSVESDHMLYKEEDLRQDYIISKIIRIMSHVIKTELKIDIELMSYDVVPLDRTKGLIEIVPDSETINDICKKGFTIQNYIMEHGGKLTVDEIKDRFIRSTAAYCIITYLLGIEDRHLDNIMIHKSGQLFHIDFGYILGYDPKISNTYIRITSGMLDAIGGPKSKKYKEFCELCTKMYNAIRKNICFFSCMLLQLNKINSKVYTIEKIESEIIKRFEPGISRFDGICHLTNLMEKSRSNDWKIGLLDTLHSTVKSIRR
jgi:hypothetical protein